MTNFLFGANNSSPDIIIGKWNAADLNPALRSLYGDSLLIGDMAGIQLNKYEFWFSSTISFIPYSGQPVFITDTSGNVTNTGNLLTKGNATINGDVTISKNLQVGADTTIDKNVNIKGNTKIDKDLRVEGDLYVRGQSIIDMINQLSAAASATPPATATADTVRAGASVPAEGTTTNITQIVQPIYDNVKIDFVNALNEANNRGSINKITFNGISADVTNGFQMGGMRSGEYVQDNKRVGIEMILSSDRTYIEPEINDGVAGTGKRDRNSAGFTTPIQLSFPTAVREFRITGIDVNKMGTVDSSGYNATVFYVDGTYQVFPLVGIINESGRSIDKNSIIITSSQSAGDIRTIVLAPKPLSGPVVKQWVTGGADGIIQGTAFITYTNLFWK